MNGTTRRIMDTTENIETNPQKLALEACGTVSPTCTHFPGTRISWHARFPGTPCGSVTECLLWLASDCTGPVGRARELSEPECRPQPSVEGNLAYK